MKGGEQAALGSMNVELFCERVSKFGWVRRARQDRNFPCAVCEAQKGHGVDLLFTIDCPYSERPRGIYVDGKRVAFKNLTSQASISEWFTSTKRTVNHLDKSQHLFREELSLPNNLVIDTGIVAWDSQGHWDEERAKKHRKEIKFASSDRPPTQLLFFGKPHLDRIETAFNLAEKCKSFEFLYLPFGYGSWHPVLTPEQIASNWWPVKFQRYNAPSPTIAILCFDLQKLNDIEILLPLIAHLQLSSSIDTIEIHVPKEFSHVAEFQGIIEAAKSRARAATNLQCKSLAFVEYKS